MAGLRPLWANTILLGLFTISLISFAFLFIGQNNADSDVLSDSVFNSTYRSLNSSLSTFQQSVEIQRNATENDKTASTISVFLILDSIITVPWALLNLAGSLVSTIWLFVFANLFGGSFAVLSGVFLGIVSGTVVFLVIKFIRVGESER